MKRLLLEMDLAGAEWVVVAYASGDARMIQVVEDKKDPHATTAELITRAPIELILKESGIVGHSTDAVEIEELRRAQCPEVYNTELVHFLPRTMSMRQCGKKTNHGANYIMGPVQFSDFAELDIGDAKRVLDAYTKDAYPGIPIWWGQVERQLQIDRTVKNCFGRKRRFLAPWGDDVVKQAVAFIPQSTVTDITTNAMSLVAENDDLCSRYDLGANVHDSLLGQLLVADWKQAAADILLMRKYLSRKCCYSAREFVIGIDLKVGLSWGKMLGVKLTNDNDKLAHDLQEAYEKLQHAKAKVA